MICVVYKLCTSLTRSSHYLAFAWDAFFCFHVRLNGSTRPPGSENVVSVLDFSSREAWFGVACSPGVVAQQPISYDSTNLYWKEAFKSAGKLVADDCYLRCRSQSSTM
jgi:hypothetical protein